MYPRTLDLARAEAAWITPPSERLVACHWCGDHAGDRTATAAHVAVAREGSLTEGDDLCATCGDALDEDALETDDVFAAVCDARQAAYLAALEALDADTSVDAALDAAAGVSL